MPNKYEHLLAQLEPYLVTYDVNSTVIAKKVLGKTLKTENIYNPLEIKSQKFIEKIYAMDRLTFGDQGMGMDKWVFVDCSVMPGFVFGLKTNGVHLTPEDRDLLGIDESEDFPLSMYIAIPTTDKDIWFGHNLSSLNGILKTPLPGLGFITKYMALAWYNIKQQRGATQWDSPALGLHLKFGPLKLLSAYTPIHSKAETLCYEAEYEISNKEILVNYKNQNSTRDFDLNLKSYKELQDLISDNKSLYLISIDRKIGKASLFIA